MDNRIREACDTLSKCHHLLHLDLSSSRFSSAACEKISTLLTYDRIVEKLDISGCRIGDSGLAIISKCFSRNASIREINMRFNAIHDTGAESFSRHLISNTSVTSIDFSRNSIGSHGASVLSEMLHSSGNITRLDLSENPLEDSGGMFIFRAFCSGTASCHIRSLKLRGAGLGENSSAMLASVLRASSSLEDLDVEGNEIGSSGCVAICAGLDGNISLQVLNLRDNDVGADGARALGHALRKHPKLYSLNVSYNDIGDDGVEELCKGLCINNTLRQLDLSLNEIGDAGATAIAVALRESVSLSELILSTNDISCLGSEALSTALVFNTSLHTLDLSDNQVKGRGGGAFGAMLCKNHFLKSLIFKENSLGLTGVLAIVQSLLVNVTMHCLDLGLNGFDDGAARVLAIALQSNTSLQELLMHGENLTIIGIEYMSKALLLNRSLRCIRLVNSTMGATGAAIIASALRQSKCLKTLQLKNCGLGNSGAIAIASMLVWGVSNISAIYLEENNISSAGARCINDAVRGNPNVTVVELSDNDIEATVESNLRSILLSNSEICRLTRNCLSSWTFSTHMHAPVDLHLAVSTFLLCGIVNSSPNVNIRMLLQDSDALSLVLSSLARGWYVERTDDQGLRSRPIIYRRSFSSGLKSPIRQSSSSRYIGSPLGSPTPSTVSSCPSPIASPLQLVRSSAVCNDINIPNDNVSISKSPSRVMRSGSLSDRPKTLESALDAARRFLDCSGDDCDEKSEFTSSDDGDVHEDGTEAKTECEPAQDQRFQCSGRLRLFSHSLSAVQL